MEPTPTQPTVTSTSNHKRLILIPVILVGMIMFLGIGYFLGQSLNTNSSTILPNQAASYDLFKSVPEELISKKQVFILGRITQKTSDQITITQITDAPGQAPIEGAPKSFTIKVSPQARIILPQSIDTPPATPSAQLEAITLDQIPLNKQSMIVIEPVDQELLVTQITVSPY